MYSNTGQIQVLYVLILLHYIIILNIAIMCSILGRLIFSTLHNENHLDLVLFTAMLLTPVTSNYLQGSLETYGPQKRLVLSEYNTCFTDIQHLSLSDSLIAGYLCLQNIFSHGIIKSPVKYSRTLVKDAFLPLKNSTYCGSIWMQEHLRSDFRAEITMVVGETYSMHLSILHFHFSCLTPFCVINIVWPLAFQNLRT